MIIEALLQSIKRVFYVIASIYNFVYLRNNWFGKIFVIPEVGKCRYCYDSLFQVLTLSSWEQVMRPLQELYWWAWIYVFSFIIICGITMLNLLIAILVDVVINQKKL